MFKRLPEAGTAPDHTTRAHASKHAFLDWLSAPELRFGPKLPNVSRLALLPVIALTLAGTTLLACGSSDTPESTASEQTAPASTQVATQSISPTPGTTSDTPSNGRSSSEPTAPPAQTPTREVLTQEATPAPEPTPTPTPEPTSAPMPTATPEPQYDLAAVLAPHDFSEQPVHRTDDDGIPVYALNDIRDSEDFNYPLYGNIQGGANLPYPALASQLRAEISRAIGTATGEAIFDQRPSNSNVQNADKMARFVEGEIHKRMEWQVADATAEQMTVNIFTQFILPDPGFYPDEQNQFNHRITATVVLTLSAPSKSDYTKELNIFYEKAPRFSHLLGEPEVTAQ